ncbi:hypothetical protein CCR75_005842 [Bremia lactucae]|uniref:SAP domain-containing protein n=1 Tax=Bremia lactucae TaxID=4779 RepID=A0A976FKY7_BRELC|nr:hypothetical protein CCR75_005842 [Bremia lactucae]
MRLTADVILRAHVSINPLRERELSLRGYKAPAIENLGVTQDGFDCIDLSDNEIKKLENFPRLRRLRMLLLHNNQVSKIQENLAEAVANLEFLMLTGNRIAQFSEVDHLTSFAKLDTLSLSGNPVTKRKYYREYVIFKLPQLRVLDFHRIRPRDREAANAFFTSIVGQRAMQVAHDERVAESAQAVKSVAVKIKEVVPAVGVVLPPPPSQASVLLVKEVLVEAELPKKTVVAEPMKKAEVLTKTAEAEQIEKAKPLKMAADTSSAKKVKAMKMVSEAEPMEVTIESKAEPADVEMEHSDEEAVAPYSPPKPIGQMTVVILREELKKLGLSTKGLKAELAKRLKEAAGQA